MTSLPGLVDGRLADATLLRDGPLARALAALNGDGEETRLVGGAVRDLALGDRPGDFDLATTALPEETIRRARAAGFGVAPTGLAHGTITVLVEGRPFETTTLREDIETFGRQATVRFGRDFRLDALRRDFTINALSLDATGRLHDYCGGRDDLAAGRVRFIGDARQRIREDYLRILRFFRFSARYAGGPLDPDGLSASIAERDGMEILSRERVRAELLKLLVAPRAGETVAVLAEAGLAGPLLAGTVDAARLVRAIAIEACFGEPPDALARLAALGVRIREDAERLHRASAAIERGVRSAGRDCSARWKPSMACRRRPALAISASCCLSAVVRAPATLCSLRRSMPEREADMARFASAFRFVSDTPQPRLPFSGADILARGIEPGKGVGAILKRLQALWIRAGFPREPEVLARLLDEATEQQGLAITILVDVD